MKGKPNGYWTKARCIAAAKRFASRAEFLKTEGGAFGACRRRGWLDEACAHMPKRKPRVPFWNLETILEISPKYKKRVDFLRNDRRAYQAAERLGLLDKVCAHMEKTITKPMGYWTDEKLISAATKYGTRSEFFYGAPGLYTMSQKRGLLDKVCAHMEFAHSGFDISKPGVLYYAAITAGNKTLFKIGITNRTVKERFGTDMAKITVLKKLVFNNGGDAAKAERSILNHCKDFAYAGPPVLQSGNTELFTTDILGVT